MLSSVRAPPRALNVCLLIEREGVQLHQKADNLPRTLTSRSWSVMTAISGKFRSTAIRQALP